MEIKTKIEQLSYEKFDGTTYVTEYMKAPQNLESYSESEQQTMYDYLYKLDNIGRHAYMISRNRLGTSHNAFRLNGFIKYKKEQDLEKDKKAV